MYKVILENKRVLTIYTDRIYNNSKTYTSLYSSHNKLLITDNAYNTALL